MTQLDAKNFQRLKDPCGGEELCSKEDPVVLLKTCP